MADKDDETSERDPQLEGEQSPASSDDKKGAEGMDKKGDPRAKRSNGGADARNVGG